MKKTSQATLVVVAHPDDESLWCGGFLLRTRTPSHVVSLCRGSDPDRAPKFERWLEENAATGTMGDLDDGPEQHPLPLQVVTAEILRLIPECPWRVVLTHGPRGEYTRHRRHEECSRAVVSLWATGQLQTQKLMLFAFDDAGRSRPPEPSADATERLELTPTEVAEKRRWITSIYGFDENSWEARIVPEWEGFTVFTEPAAALDFVQSRSP